MLGGSNGVIPCYSPIARQEFFKKEMSASEFCSCFQQLKRNIYGVVVAVGGLGLNLTAADTVVFMEHDWNPMRDLQVRLSLSAILGVFILAQ